MINSSVINLVHREKIKIYKFVLFISIIHSNFIINCNDYFILVRYQIMRNLEILLTQIHIPLQSQWDFHEKQSIHYDFHEFYSSNPKLPPNLEVWLSSCSLKTVRSIIFSICQMVDIFSTMKQSMKLQTNSANLLHLWFFQHLLSLLRLPD